MAKRRVKAYFCAAVSEDVEITLKKRSSLFGKSKNEMYIQCNQFECQYVELNQSPCPLRLELFAKEIDEGGENIRDGSMES